MFVEPMEDRGGSQLTASPIFNFRISSLCSGSQSKSGRGRSGRELYVTLCGAKGSRRERYTHMICLLVFCVLPGLILVVKSITHLIDSTKILSTNQLMVENILFSMSIENIIHMTQIERGTTTLYVSSNRDPFLLPRLRETYHNTDDAIDELKTWLPLNEPEHFRSHDAYHKLIQNFRDTNANWNATINDVIKFYTSDNAVLIGIMERLINVEKSVSYWPLLVAYQMLIVSKEQAGIERALGSTYFSRGEFPADELLWYKEKQSLGMSYLQRCMGFSDTTRRLVHAMFTETPLARSINVLRDVISANVVTTPSVVSGALWFDNMTEYIDILEDIQHRLGNAIIDKTTDYSRSLKNGITMQGLELAIVLLVAPAIVLLVWKIVSKIQTFSLDLQERTSELEQERKRTENLLSQLLPATIAGKFRKRGPVLPEAYSSATIMVLNVAEFTSAQHGCTPAQIIRILTKIDTAIDERLCEYDAFRIETTSDGYTVASGLPLRNGDRHAYEMARLALDLRDSFSEMKLHQQSAESLQLRIGIHTGPVVAGVVDNKTPRYCVVGETVTVARRLEATGQYLKIQISEAAVTSLRSHDCFLLDRRGPIKVKDDLEMTTYWLDGWKLTDGVTTPTVLLSNVRMITVEESANI